MAAGVFKKWLYKPVVQISFAVSLESATLIASSAGLFCAASFAASSRFMSVSIDLIFDPYARIAEVHDATAEL